MTYKIGGGGAVVTYKTGGGGAVVTYKIRQDEEEEHS